MPKRLTKLTAANQGYWDRLKRARSWVDRANALERAADEQGSSPDQPELFVLYWIAFNALYGRVTEGGRGRYLRPGEDDARWFIARICELDTEGRLSQAIDGLKRDVGHLLSSHFLFDDYWRSGYTGRVKQELQQEADDAEQALAKGSLNAYLTTVLWGRIRVLRNQIFHGCASNRDSLNRHTLTPAVRVLRALIPTFLDVKEARIDKETDWPLIPYPRWDSEQHPRPRGPRG
jgi:hypothetical protein